MILLVDTLVNVAIWINIESNIGIVSACIPAMRPLFNVPFFANARSRFRRSLASRHFGESSQNLQGSKEVSSSLPLRQSHDGETKMKQHSYKQKEEVAKHSSWYSAAVEGNGDQPSNAHLEDDMVPLGRIAVRYDIELSDRGHV